MSEMVTKGYKNKTVSILSQPGNSILLIFFIENIFSIEIFVKQTFSSETKMFYRQAWSANRTNINIKKIYYRGALLCIQ